MPCRIIAFSRRKREMSPRENPLNGDFGGFSHDDLSNRQAEIRQTGGEMATHEKCRTFVWRGEMSPCENMKKSPFGGFSRGAFSPRKHDNTKWHKSATIEKKIFPSFVYNHYISMMNMSIFFFTPYNENLAPSSFNVFCLKVYEILRQVQSTFVHNYLTYK